ncbi:MAG: hypothetical protein JKY70_09850 [Mucilaginibacter sp.]|nr:hypothetical protein [Mucilaginibacter sp.]
MTVLKKTIFLPIPLLSFILLTGCNSGERNTSVSNKQLLQDSTLLVTLANPSDSDRISVLVNEAAATKIRINQGQLLLRIPGNEAIDPKHATVKITVKLNDQVLSVVDLPYQTKPKASTSVPVSQAENLQKVDLIKLAPAAGWHSGVLLADSSTIAEDKILNWPGLETDASGYAREDSVILEDGSHQFVLRMHPKWVDNGSVYGDFPIKGMKGRRSFSATVGFVKDVPTNTVSTDGVTFQVWVAYSLNGQAMKKMIFSRHKNQDRSLYTIPPVALPDEVPPDFTLELRVNAGKQSLTDWAAWIRPQLKNPLMIPVVPELKITSESK